MQKDVVPKFMDHFTEFCRITDKMCLGLTQPAQDIRSQAFLSPFAKLIANAKDNEAANF